MNRGQTGCNDIIRSCQNDPFLDRCKVTRNLGVPNNEDQQNCERSVPDHCIEQFVETLYSPNGTRIQGVNLSCRDVNATDFRVTIDDIRRHQFDRDYDGIGCENK